ncbi:TonB-dependent receptor [Rhizorhabdus wittichii]|uniref:TonB-dependent receptor n=1 Tax=Rhizorhabdus wittichii TaxID=160791 RepID=A0A975D2R6_9SPHN|nr:TonB-dependent receptor [Rhizorhabdus wittichii]QTH21146.1 TonB-dependent receptor [Rhizorhabdus wittichii]
MLKSNRLSSRSALHLATAIGLVLVPGAGFAQAVPAEDAAGPTSGLQDIVVTARRSSESAQNVPIAITTVTAENLQRLSVRDVVDIQKVTPGLFISSQNTGGRAKLTIRGQTEADSRLSTDGSVGVYIDGVPLTRSYGLRSNMIDLAQIEVLKGPQGTLFGKNTTGGALNITTQHPTYQLGGYVDLLYGSYDNKQIVAALNLPIVDDKLAVRVVGQRIHRDGYGENGVGVDVGVDRAWFGRALVRADPTDDLHILLSADYYKQNNTSTNVLLTYNGMLARGNSATGSLGAIAAQLGLDPTSAADRMTAYNQWLTYFSRSGNQYTDSGDFYGNAGTGPIVDDVKHYGFSATLEYELGDVTLKSISALRRLRVANGQDLDSTPFSLQHSLVTTRQKNFSQEFQASAIDGTGLDWQLGLFYNKETGNEGSFSNALSYVNTGRASVVDADLTNKSKAAYAQAVYNFGGGFRVTGGLRYTKDDRAVTSHNRRDVSYANDPVPPASRNACFVTVGGGSIDPAVCTYSASTSSKKMTWLASADWRPLPQLMVYGSYSRGYRAGGFSIQAASSVPATAATLAANFTPFLPEVVDNFELGFKSDLLDRRLRINGAVFRQNYTNIQAQIRDAVNGQVVTLIRNAAKAKPYGGEIEVTAQITPEWQINGSAAYLRAKYDKYFALDATGNLQDLSNLSFPAPKWTWNAGTSYTLPVANGSIEFNANLSYRSLVNFRPQVGQNDASVSQPGYTLLDARIAYNIDSIGVNIAVFGKNLTKERYLNAATNLESLGWNVGFPGDPRTFGVQLRKTF